MSDATHIRVLPTHVANKIAAGEVVERPASVLKELLENALDAGATQIDVEITAGGRKLVAVRDNGRGMGRDDALLSIERQATSKIRDVDDIDCIATLGFRGEALAAIGSVSRMRVNSCEDETDGGTEVNVVAGKLMDVRDIGCPRGTEIEVRDLFFNVPARRKFLRAHQTELGHVRNTFIVQALASYSVGMSLRVDGRDAYTLGPANEFADRLRDIFGSDYVRNLAPLAHRKNGVGISGYVSMPTYSRADREEQYVFVNGRASTAPVVGFAIREGFRGQLPKDRHPAVFLMLTVDPGQVDVNVHPTKREIRFRQTHHVRDAVIAAIREALGARPVDADDLPTEPPTPVAPAKAEIQMRIENLPEAPTFQYPRRTLNPSEEAAAAAALEAAGLSEPDSPDTAPDAGNAPWSWCRVVGIVGGRYVLLETEDGVVQMDPRAAHERVLYERFLADMSGKSVPVQNMLMPETVELRPRDADRVRRLLPLLQDMGFGIAEFGGDVFVIDAVPAYFAASSAEALLLEIVSALEAEPARGKRGEQWREAVIAGAACRAAVQSRDRLKLEEVEQLVKDLAAADMPYTCPRGKPTLIYTSFRELDRKFGRT